MSTRASRLPRMLTGSSRPTYALAARTRRPRRPTEDPRARYIFSASASDARCAHTAPRCISEISAVHHALLIA